MYKISKKKKVLKKNGKDEKVTPPETPHAL